MQPCLIPGLEVSEACGGSLWLWDVHGGRAAGQTCGEQSCCGGASCLLYLLFLEGSIPCSFFFFFSSSFSPERTEFILSGQQSLSVRGLQGGFSKARKQ